MSAYPNATPGQIKSALLDGANKDKNPIVYPYDGFVKSYVAQWMEFEDQIENYASPESRDAKIAEYTRRAEKRYAPYKQLDGAGRVSRTGMLDVKAAYDLLEKRSHGSGSSSGCNAGVGAAVMILAVGFILSRRKFSE